MPQALMELAPGIGAVRLDTSSQAGNVQLIVLRPPQGVAFWDSLVTNPFEVS